jgi:NADPH-dependent glutamate synthase beta subunit-like oxidoreductase
MQACPVHTQAGRYVTLIARVRYEDAYRCARAPNPFASVCGRVCGHPWETDYRRGHLDAPTSIRALKLFLTEHYGPESKTPIDIFPEKPGVIHAEDRVAVIGSGAAGLSAAHDLALLGYPVTAFEAAPVPGGMMHLAIPEYRLPRSMLQAQVRDILDLAMGKSAMMPPYGHTLNKGDIRAPVAYIRAIAQPPYSVPAQQGQSDASR